MQFLKYDLGHLEGGSTVVVTLTTGANVRLMDSSNFYDYKAGRSHRYYGGLAKVSPSHIVVPHSGVWYLTVDLAGLAASSVNVGINVEPPSS